MVWYDVIESWHEASKWNAYLLHFNSLFRIFLNAFFGYIITSSIMATSSQRLWHFQHIYNDTLASFWYVFVCIFRCSQFLLLNRKCWSFMLEAETKHVCKTRETQMVILGYRDREIVSACNWIKCNAIFHSPQHYLNPLPKTIQNYFQFHLIH